MSEKTVIHLHHPITWTVSEIPSFQCSERIPSLSALQTNHRPAHNASYIWNTTLSRICLPVLCVCVQLNKDFSVCESESSDPYQRSNLLHHQHNTRPFKHTHPGYSRVIHFGPGKILVSIKLGMFQQPIYSARVRQVLYAEWHSVKSVFTVVIFKVVLPLSGVERNCKLKVFLFITQSSHLCDTTLIWNSQTKLWYYLYSSAILCPNHIPPFHQWSLQGVQSCLPEPYVPTHIHSDHTSRTERSYYHIGLWHFGQPTGVRWYRHWPANHKNIGKSIRELIKRASRLLLDLNFPPTCKSCCQSNEKLAMPGYFLIQHGDRLWCVSFSCLPW